MGSPVFQSVLDNCPWVIVLVVGTPVAGKIVITALALRGAPPEARPGIIKAVAELFRWHRR